MAKADVELRRSANYDKSAQEIAADWRRRDVLRIVFAFVAVAAILAWLFLMPSSPLAIGAIIVIAVAACLSLQVLPAHAWQPLQEVLMVDCDPAKLLEAVRIILPTVRSKRTRPVFQSVEATCTLLVGKPEEAIELADELIAATDNTLIKISALNTKAEALRALGRIDEQADVRARLVELQAALPREMLAQNPVALDCAYIDFSFALRDGSWDACEEQLATIDRMITTPQQVVSSEHAWAQLEEARGNEAAAREHYAYVAEHGGTMSVRSEAEAWLSAHSADALES